MKTTTNFNKTGLLLVLFGTLFLTSSCFLNGIKGNGEVVTETRNFSEDFNEIEVAAGINAYLTQEDSQKVVVEADSNLHDIIITEVEDGVLHVYSEKNIYRAKAKKVYISASDIERLKITSGSSLKTENTLKGDELDIRVSSGANAKLFLSYQAISCDVSSGANAKLEGSTGHVNFEASSGANLKAKKLEARTGEARASSGANISLYITEKLDAKASSGGNINYDGNPKEVNKDSSSGGDIRG